MSNSPSPRKQSVLVVDDHADVCDFIRAALESAGYEVNIASEGGTALELQRSKPAALLITDIFMPGREGMETIAAFKREFPETRVIAMTAGTGYGDHDFLATAKLIGADATLRKPFDADQLLETVSKTLQRS
jgi:DNA-binding NtrC family response regulator